MSKKRILFVTQEMSPYLEQSSIAKIVRYLAPYIQKNEYEIRVLMPRFGTINEKRHRLHEVVRLSGINITVNDEDNPLIIKVASLPEAKMQVYFLDNEDLFKRKTVFRDDTNKFHDDNDMRTAFFCKGVLETVVKLGWKPDLIHCNGWMTSLIPMYLKTMYKDEPIYDGTKAVYSLYENAFPEVFADGFEKKVDFDDDPLEAGDLEAFKAGDFKSLNMGAMKYSDALIVGNENIDPVFKEEIANTDKPVLGAQEESEYLGAYVNFFKEVLETAK